MLYAIASIVLIALAWLGMPGTAIAVSVAIAYLAIINELRYRPQTGERP
jgi:hypothetical protein